MVTKAKYRQSLPQRDGTLFLTDGGIETTLIFQDGFDLPYFAAFHLLGDARGREALVRYYERYIAIAKAERMGFVLESPTWRASADWGAKLGYSADDIVAANRDAAQLMHDLRARHETAASPMVVSGCVGPRGDGYDPGQVMTALAAEDYHRLQIEAFRRRRRRHGERHHHDQRQRGDRHYASGSEGRHARGHLLHRGDRWPAADRAEPGRRDLRGRRRDEQGSRLLHDQLRPSHALRQDARATSRGRGASAACAPTPPRRSHQELNDSADLDAGNPVELGGQYRDLLRRHPQINVLGGCCGTDHRHVECIALACHEVKRAA